MEDLTQINPPDGDRYYLTPDGVRYDSVTTILKRTKEMPIPLLVWAKRSKSDDPAEGDKILDGWVRSGKVTPEWAEGMRIKRLPPRRLIIAQWGAIGKLPAEVLKQAEDEDWSVDKAVEWMGVAGASRGTALHSMIENYFKTGVEGSGPYWDSIRWFLVDQVTRMHCTEKMVLHRQLRYAGTLDARGDVRVFADKSSEPCENVLLDWKSADAPKVYEWIEDYRLQAAAYAAAERHSGAAAVEHACVVIAIPKREAQQFWMGPEDLRDAWSRFQRRVKKFRELQR